MTSPKIKKAVYMSLALVTTFLSYTSLHASRTSWSNIEIDLAESTSISKHTSGLIDAIFLAFYCFGMFFMGWIGDQVNLRYFLFTGLAFSALFYGIIGVMGMYGYSNTFAFIFFFSLNGIAQAVGWPACVGSIGNWVSKGTSGLILTVWSTSTNVGNIIGQEFGIIFGTQNDSWYKVVLFSAGYILLTAFLVLLFLRPYPEAIGIDIDGTRRHSSLRASRIFGVLDAESENYPSNKHESLPQTETHESLNADFQLDPHFIQKAKSETLQKQTTEMAEKRKGMGFFDVLRLPGVLMYCVIYACTKAIAYGIMYGFKTQVQENIVHDPVLATKITQYGDLSQLIGGIIFGGLTDVLNARALMAPFMLGVAACFMFLMTVVQTDPMVFMWTFILFSFFFGGPYLVVGTAIATDLAKNKAISGNERVLSTISGTIDASGSFGAMLMSLLVPHLTVNQVFYCFAAFTIIVGLLILRPAYHDFLDIKERRKHWQLKKKLLDPTDQSK